MSSQIITLILCAVFSFTSRFFVTITNPDTELKKKKQTTKTKLVFINVCGKHLVSLVCSLLRCLFGFSVAKEPGKFDLVYQSADGEELIEYAVPQDTKVRGAALQSRHLPCCLPLVTSGTFPL